MKAIITTLGFAVLSSAAAFAQYEDPLYAPPRSNKERRTVKKEDYQSYADIQKRLNKIDSYNFERTNEIKPIEKAEDIVVSSIDDALQRRVKAINTSPSNDQSMENLLNSYASLLQKQYTPDLYNIMIYNDNIWVEPKYITAMFTGNDEVSKGLNNYMSKARKQLRQERSFEDIRSSIPYGSGVGWLPGYYNPGVPAPYWRFGWGGYPYYTGGYWGGYPGSPLYWGWGGNIFIGGYPPYWGWGGCYNNYWGGGFWDPWHPWYNRPVYNVPRHPVYYGNSDRSIYRHNSPTVAPSVTPGYGNNYQRPITNNGSNGSTNKYNSGYGQGQSNYRPQTNSNSGYTPSAPPSNNSGVSGGGGGYSGGYQDSGGSRRR